MLKSIIKRLAQAALPLVVGFIINKVFKSKDTTQSVKNNNSNK
ncbi:MAG: hypothetical protein SGI89_07515 [bacterium]|nr:hypothetical protein [bacterium]